MSDDLIAKRLDQIAEALGIEVADLMREDRQAEADQAELLELFSQIKDLKLRKAVLDLAREYATAK